MIVVIKPAAPLLKTGHWRCVCVCGITHTLLVQVETLFLEPYLSVISMANHHAYEGI
jgi:hypothetical protein